MSWKMKDSDGDEVEVSAERGERWVFLSLQLDGIHAAGHAYTPKQARRLAALLMKAADELDATKSKQLKAGMP